MITIHDTNDSTYNNDDDGMAITMILMMYTLVISTILNIAVILNAEVSSRNNTYLTISYSSWALTWYIRQSTYPHIVDEITFTSYTATTISNLSLNYPYCFIMLPLHLCVYWICRVFECIASLFDWTDNDTYEAPYIYIQYSSIYHSRILFSH